MDPNTGESRRAAVGILAHADAGKTTLSEALLYTAGAIRKAGRVDRGESFLDTDEEERRRGITIFSKQAAFRSGECSFTLLDTPGHVDFSAEAERTLRILDAAILVVSGTEGVQPHTRTIWKLLQNYRIPALLFVNKTDRPGVRKEALLTQLEKELGGPFFDFTQALGRAEIQEELALLDEALLERYLGSGIPVGDTEIRRLIGRRKLFPCWFGSALRLDGIREFLSGLERFVPAPDYGEEFGARVFKITRDGQGARLSWMKVTGGTLRVKMPLPGSGEKADELRLYSGDQFVPLREAPAGSVVAATGLERTRAGEGLGFERTGEPPLLAPVLSYRILLPAHAEAAAVYPKLRLLNEEDPSLHILWDERAQEIRVRLMGEMQLQVLKKLIARRYSLAVDFGEPSVSYRETIRGAVEGVGHFEPLRHYAEVHLILEEGPPGSGLRCSLALPPDQLDAGWQRLILSELQENLHPGVLTGSPLTDMKITVASGKAHKKHTAGGDFRQAARRALRNGLMQAENVLLEPWYRFSLLTPRSAAGKVLFDLERMKAQFAPAEDAALSGEEGGSPAKQEALPADFLRIEGMLPVSESLNYADELRSCTRGEGRLSLTLAGYFPCHDAAAAIEARGYRAEQDTEYPADSVFCIRGSGVIVPWDRVREHMHLPPALRSPCEEEAGAAFSENAAGEGGPAEGGPVLSLEEIDAIINRTFFANRRKKEKRRPRESERRREFPGGAAEGGRGEAPEKKRPEKEYLLVDAYNIIFAWDELRALAHINLDSARLALLDILSNYQGHRGCELIAVFDAYRLKNHPEETFDRQNLHLVFTKTAQTADSYIEAFSLKHARTDRVVVATSDGVEQLITRSSGSELLSAAELKADILRLDALAAEELEKSAIPKNRPMEELLKKVREGRPPRRRPPG